MNIPFIGSDDSDSGRPPKPDPEEKETTEELPYYQVTLHYENGDVETIDCAVCDFGESTLTLSPGSLHVKVFLWPTVEWREVSEGKVVVPYRTLTRAPIVEQIGTNTVHVEWERGYTWERWPGKWDKDYGTLREWEADLERFPEEDDDG